MDRYTDIEVYRYTYIEMYRCADVQTYRHICICASLDQLDCFQPGSKTLAARQHRHEALTLFKCQMETTFRRTDVRTYRHTDNETIMQTGGRADMQAAR